MMMFRVFSLFYGNHSLSCLSSRMLLPERQIWKFCLIPLLKVGNGGLGLTSLLFDMKLSVKFNYTMTSFLKAYIIPSRSCGLNLFFWSSFLSLDLSSLCILPLVFPFCLITQISYLKKRKTGWILCSFYESTGHWRVSIRSLYDVLFVPCSVYNLKGIFFIHKTKYASTPRFVIFLVLVWNSLN